MTGWTSKGSIRIGCPPRGLRHGWQRPVGAQAGLASDRGAPGGEEALFDAALRGAGARDPLVHGLRFSTENWRRPQDEVRFLLTVIADSC